MTIEVKSVFCGGALITSDDMDCHLDNEFVGFQAVVLTGEEAGRGVPIHHSTRHGAFTVGGTHTECLVDHNPDCEGTTYCDCFDCEGHECGCETEYAEPRFEPAPLRGLVPGDKIRLVGTVASAINREFLRTMLPPLAYTVPMVDGPR